MTRSSEADCVIALSFGIASQRSVINVNKELANCAESYGLPVIAQIEIAGYCHDPSASISKNDGYLDTWGVLNEAKKVMAEHGWRSAVLVAHQAHISRASRQAAKVGLAITVGSNSPSLWDAYSKQWWTRSSWLWRLHELKTVPYLHLIGKI
jgi:uncharacterized SAM-binding protein YcdF (DUF218 family)